MAEIPVVLNSNMNGNEVSIHTTPNSYPKSATPKSLIRVGFLICRYPKLCGSGYTAVFAGMGDGAKPGNPGNQAFAD